MQNLTRDELAGIETRAQLCFEFGDTTALRAEDVAALLTEVRELRAHCAHLTALYRQTHQRLTEEQAQTWGRAVPWHEWDSA